MFETHNVHLDISSNISLGIYFSQQLPPLPLPFHSPPFPSTPSPLPPSPPPKKKKIKKKAKSLNWFLINYFIYYFVLTNICFHSEDLVSLLISKISFFI